jgi:hypothetical protein
MDPPNVLWFAGTYAIAFASYALIGALPESHDSLWIFLTGLALLLVYAAASYLLRERWWVPSGLAAALAVGMVPAVGVGFLRLIDVWSADVPLTHFNGCAVAVAIVTAIAGLIAFWLTRFSFLFLTVVAAILVTAQFLALAGDSSAGGNDRATAALVTGGLIVIAGVFLDAFGRRRDAFWFHALGWFSAAAGLVFFIVEPGGNPDRGWIPMLIVGTLIVIASGPIRRATWAAYGVLGYYAPLLHYMITGLNESRWTFAVALFAAGLSIFVLGLLLHRYGRKLAETFVRRPPPGVTPA